VLIERSMHPDWLSNAFVIADREGGTALFVDSGPDIGPLVAAVEQWGVTPAAILRTHTHHDHVVHEQELQERYGIAVVAEPGEWEWGGLHVRGVATPGHSDDMVAFLVDDVVFSGDTLFKDAVGGGNLEQVRSSVMDVFMALPDETRVLPGHTDETTIGRERVENPFVTVWSGAAPEGSERVKVAGRDATLVVWSPDYDGKGKAWVRFDDGEDAIVGGSRVER
jgi:glyoxylase-like metal-dependent hydrolase (beta-lactamase superfamily II)